MLDLPAITMDTHAQVRTVRSRTSTSFPVFNIVFNGYTRKNRF